MGEGYQAFVKRLAKASVVQTRTRTDLVRFEWKCKKKTSNYGVGESTRLGRYDHQDEGWADPFGYRNKKM